MATTKNVPQTNPAETAEQAPFSQDLLPMEDAADLIEVAKKLEAATSNFQKQRLEYERIQQTQNDLKKAMSTIIKGMEAYSSQPVAALSAQREIAPSHGTNPRTDCGNCSCSSPNCCYYDFILRKVKLVTGQRPVDSAGFDTETTTGIVGDHTGLECQFFISMEGSGIIVPEQLWSYIRLRKRRYSPGVWYPLERVVKRVSVPYGQTRMIPFRIQGVEKEIGVVETTTGWFDEYGEATDTLVLDCNCCKSGPIHVMLTFSGGGAGEGTVEMVFEAEKVCC